MLIYEHSLGSDLSLAKTQYELIFLTFPTATFRILYVFVILHHERREIVHFNVTEHPTAQCCYCRDSTAAGGGLSLRFRSTLLVA
jgi:hypothetical protein